ncbi:MAG: trypsin-like peptidase domain-containing protein [Planctomycetota bacterium]
MRSLLFILLIIFTIAAHTGRADEGAITSDGNQLAAKAFHRAAQSILPSIVTIETYGGVATGARRGRIAGVSKPGVGPTTGLIISDEGHILTSTYNFRDKPSVITVILRSGEKHVATMLSRDDERRICLLKIKSTEDVSPPPRAEASELKIGQWAVAVGVGYGDFEPAISAGIISALNRFKVNAVQTDANISPANYGGPLLSIDGRVIGICVPMHPNVDSDTAGSEWYDSGIGFAVPIADWDAVIKQLSTF